MEVPVASKIIDFIKQCPFDKYIIGQSFIRKPNNKPCILNVERLLDGWYIGINGVDVSNYYSKKDLEDIKEALAEAYKHYQQYQIDNFIYDDLNPILNTYSSEELLNV